MTGAEPHVTVKRWSKTESKEIEVPCPAIVKSYNDIMGGVDVYDQQIECYRTWVKTKKWTLKMAMHFIDLSIVNARMEYREDAEKMRPPKKEILDLMNLKMSVAQEWLSTTVKKLSLPEESSSSDTEEFPQKLYRPQNYRAPVQQER